MIKQFFSNQFLDAYFGENRKIKILHFERKKIKYFSRMAWQALGKNIFFSIGNDKQTDFIRSFKCQNIFIIRSF